MIVKGFFRYRVYSFLIFLILLGPAFADFEGPPVVVVTPDAFPTNVSFFFPAGSPLERFTNQRDAWYAIYQTSLYPGYPYSIILRHNGDPSRVKLFALDKHPFDRVSMKMELHMKKTEIPSYIHGKWPPLMIPLSVYQRILRYQVFFCLSNGLRKSIMTNHCLFQYRYYPPVPAS